MRVLMQKTMAGPSGCYDAGNEYDVPEGVARAMQADGTATLLGSAAGPPKVEADTAMLAPPQNAAQPKPKRK